MAQVDKKALVKTGTLSAGVILVAALVAIVNYFGYKYHQRFDWTSNRLYTLSEKSLNVAKGLQKDVEAVVFLAPTDPLYEPTQEVLARYAAASTHLKVRMVDVAKNPVEAEQLVRKYGVTNAGVVLASGNDKRVIDSADLAELDYSTMQLGQQPQMTGYKGEQLFTSALLELAEGKKAKVLFTTGHGERSLDDQGPRGLAGAAQILGRDNFDISEWASLGQSGVPAGTDMVVIAGPSGSFVPPELAAFSAYLDGGGRMLVLLDPTIGQAAGSGLAQTGLEAWLQGYGIKAGQDIVIDPSNPLPFFGAETIFVKSYGEHPITKPLAQANLPVLFSLARSMAKGDSGDATVTELLKTSPDGWGETDIVHLDKVAKDGGDQVGPVAIAVAVERKGKAPGARTSRLVAFGDSDFATDQLLQANVANSVLLSNALNWLVEREALLGIPPKKTEQVHLTLTGDELRNIYLIVLGLLPGLAILAGGWVYLRRRR
jgi:LPXTG-motif cell wall-anchored protein